MVAARINRFSESGGRIPGVEIFRSGYHRRKHYTENDIREMVENFHKFSTEGAKPGVQVPAVLGHEENQQWLDRSDLPAAGWATKVGYERQECPICHGEGTIDRGGHKDVCPDCKGKGSVLVLKADFQHVPKEVKRLLDGKAYKTVSAEVYDDLPDGLPEAGKKSKMLRRVAFLGGEIPQLKTLSDIPAVEDMAESGPRYERVELQCTDCCERNGCFTAFYEVRRPQKFCQQGSNAGKPGPCPEGGGSKPSAAKPIGMAAAAAAHKPAEKPKSEKKSSKETPKPGSLHTAEVKEREAVQDATEKLGKAKAAEIARATVNTVRGAIMRVTTQVTHVIKDKEQQTSAVQAMVSTAEYWAHSKLLADFSSSGNSPISAAYAASHVASFIAAKVLSALKPENAAKLLKHVLPKTAEEHAESSAKLTPESIQAIVKPTLELLASIKRQAKSDVPLPTPEELAKMLGKQATEHAEKFCQETKKPGPCKGYKRGGAKPAAAPAAARVSRAPRKKAYQTELEAAKARITAAGQAAVKKATAAKKPSTSKRRLKPGGAAATKRIAEARKENIQAGPRVVKTESAQPKEDFTPGGFSKAKKKRYDPMVGWYREYSEGAMERDEMVKKLIEMGYKQEDIDKAPDETLAAILRHGDEHEEAAAEHADDLEAGMPPDEESNFDEEEEAIGMDQDTEAGEMHTPNNPAETEQYEEGDEDEDEEEDASDDDIDAMSEEDAKELAKKYRDRGRRSHAEYDEGGAGSSDRTHVDEEEPNQQEADMSPPAFSEQRRRGGKHMVKFSELRDAIATEVAGMVGNAMREEFSAFREAITKEVRSGKKQFNSFKETALRTEKLKKVTKFCERMSAEGRISPARMRKGPNGEPSIVDHLMSLDNVTAVHKFKEGAVEKKRTALGQAMAEIAATQPFKFGEKLPSADGKRSTATTMSEEKKRSLSAMCDRFSEQFARCGTSAEEFKKIMADTSISQKDKDAIVADLQRASEASAA